MLRIVVRKLFLRSAMRLSKRILISGFILVIVLAFLNLFERIEHARTNKTSICSKMEDELAYISSNLKVQIMVHKEKLMTIQLTNVGTHDITNCPWEIYFSLIAIPLTPTFVSDIFKVDHVNGFLFKLYTDSSKGFNVIIGVGHVEVIKVYCHLLAKHYAFPNWLIVGPDLASNPLVISSTSLEYKNMISINSTLSSEKRFEINNEINFNDGEKNGSEKNWVIPTPLHIIGKEPVSEYINISFDWSVSFNVDDLFQEATILKDIFHLRKISKYLPHVSLKDVIFLQLIEEKEFYENWMDDIANQPGMRDAFKSHDAYKILTLKNRVVLQATTPTGIFYGIRTIVSLCHNKRSKDKLNRSMPALNITDAPRYNYRGLMIDVARHFLDASFIKKVITVMSLYKMNILHLHLTDDEGWRIEIPGFPELTSIGSNPTAKFNSKPKFDFLNPYLGAHPTSRWNGQRQYYTSKDYINILKHAAFHHVTVIPEIDFPGHSHAALVSMRAKRNRSKFIKDYGIDLSTGDISSIEDENDTSNDASINKVSDTVINVCRNSTISFMKEVVEAMISYHELHQPLKMIHLGGDEVSDQALLHSPICQKFLNKNMSSLRSFIVEQLLQLGSDHNLKIILWESNQRDSHFVNSLKPIIHFWLPSPDLDREKIVMKYIKAGSDVILSEGNSFYLDHPYEPCTHELGLRWATKSINEFDIFKYIPPNVCRDGANNCEDILQHIIGIQANLWGELILKRTDAEYMLFPRLLAVAERAWHQSNWQWNLKKAGSKEVFEEWHSFASAIVDRELPLLKNFGINFRIPPPGARLMKDRLEYNTLFPGLKVKMSADGGVTWFEGQKLNKNMILATKFGKRFSRKVILD